MLTGQSTGAYGISGGASWFRAGQIPLPAPNDQLLSLDNGPRWMEALWEEPGSYRNACTTGGGRPAACGGGGQRPRGTP